MPFKWTAARPWQRYLFAFIAVAIGAGLRAAFLAELGDRIPFVTFFPAILLVALFAGMPAAAMASVLSAAWVRYRMGSFEHVLLVRDPGDRIVMGIAVVSCTAVYLIAHALGQAQRRAAAAEIQARFAEQHKAIEEKLLATESHYRAFFENSMDAIFLAASDSGQITAANRAACTTFGMSEEEICRIGRAGVFDTSDPRLAAALRKLSDTGEVRCEFTCVRKDGTRFPSEISSIILDATTGGSLTILRDITDRKRIESQILELNAGLEQRVRERTAELEAAVHEQECFSYSVSHDLRAPLRHINSFSSILMEDFGAALPEEARHYLERITGATGRMGSLIDNLLELSRVSRTEMSRDQVDLSRMATEISTMLRETEPQRRTEFSVEEGLLVQGDRQLLRQLLENLLGNAWKYSAPRPTAHIAFGRIPWEGRESFFVKDDGVGFEMAYSAKLFEVFQRLHGAEFEGAGIGLATAQRIVQRHGGTISAQGAVDQGAIFYFTLG